MATLGTSIEVRFDDKALKRDPGYFDKHDKAEAQAEQTAVAAAKRKHPGTLAGEILAWPRGDGTARYLILSEKPLVLACIATGDAWQVEYALIRGLTAAAARRMVEGERKFHALFAKKGQGVSVGALASALRARDGE